MDVDKGGNGEYGIVGVGLIRIGCEKEWKKIFMGKIKSWVEKKAICYRKIRALWGSTTSPLLMSL